MIQSAWVCLFFLSILLNLIQFNKHKRNDPAPLSYWIKTVTDLFRHHSSPKKIHKQNVSNKCKASTGFGKCLFIFSLNWFQQFYLLIRVVDKTKSKIRYDFALFAQNKFDGVVTYTDVNQHVRSGSHQMFSVSLSFTLSSFSITVLHSGGKNSYFRVILKNKCAPKIGTAFVLSKDYAARKKKRAHTRTLVSRLNNEIIEMQRLINLVVTTWHCKNQNTDNLSCNECVEQFNFNLKTKTTAEKKNARQIQNATRETHTAAVVIFADRFWMKSETKTMCDTKEDCNIVYMIICRMHRVNTWQR